MNPFVAQIKHLYQNGSMTVRLVMVNVGVFVIIQIFNTKKWVSYAVKFFIGIVKSKGFQFFGYYRIIIGSIFLVTLYL